MIKPNPTLCFSLVPFCLVWLACVENDAAEAPISEPARPISGSLILHGGGKLGSSILDAFIKLAGGADARIVLIPSAGSSAEINEEDADLAAFRTRGVHSAVLLNAKTHQQANADEPGLTMPLNTATGVWINGGSDLEKIYAGTRVETGLHAVMSRGGVIAANAEGARAMSEVAIRAGKTGDDFGRGFGLLAGVVIETHFLKRNGLERMNAILTAHPGLAGLGIDESTALIVHERRMGIFGESSVTVCFSASANRPAKTQTLKNAEMCDLVAISRAAIARAKPLFPPIVPSVPEVAGNGTLVIEGGGMLTVALKRFIDGAGGADAPIVIIPTALGEDAVFEPIEVALLRRAGAKNLKIIDAHNQAQASEPEYLKILNEAKGIWFCGGRQWRLVDSYLDTPAEKLMHAVLQRGGSIGGTSAGATIQGEYLVRGNPLGNREMMAEGYERGLGFLKGVAIDQHFTQRDRFSDMSVLKQTFPQLIGLGIDENTVLIVRGHVMEVIGEHNVAVYDRDKPAAAGEGEGEKEYRVLKPGEFYDLKKREAVQPSSFP